jgi:thioesterase domain-containing protein
MCFGNAVALEMACRLIDRGEDVAALIILDSGIRYVPEGRTKLGQYVRRVAEDGIDQSMMRKAVRYASRKVRKSRKLLHTAGRNSWHDLKARFGGVDIQATDRFQIAQEKAWRTYVPRTFPGRITFVRSAGIAEQRRFDYQVPRWSERAGEGLDIHVVPGDHETLMSEPHVRTLAARLQTCLDVPTRVQASTTAEQASFIRTGRLSPSSDGVDCPV